jgi:hypothetical protein
VALLWGQWHRTSLIKRHASWPQTTATVLSTRAVEKFVGDPSSGIRLQIYGEVDVAYRANGDDRTATARINGLANTEDLDSRLPAETDIDISYDPDDPEDVYYDIGDVRLEFTDMTIPGLALLLAAAGIAFASRRHRTTER